MPIVVQVVRDDVSKFRDLLTTNGQHVAQTRTLDQQVVAGITAETSFIPIAGTNACWTSMDKKVALFIAAADAPLFLLVLQVKIQHRKRKSSLWYLLFLWLLAVCNC
mgnify:CR=1 FL=1